MGNARVKAGWLLALAALAAACGKTGHDGKGSRAQPAVATDAGAPAVGPVETAPPTPAPAPTRTAPSPPPPPLDLDGGASACRSLRPTYVDPSFIGPVVLRIEDRGAGSFAELVFNDSGVPRIITVAADAPDSASEPIAARTKSALPSCAAAGGVLFCPDANGVVHAWRGERHAIVAHARAGTDLSAAAIGDHVALAYLAERVTSEGPVREAWAVLDEGSPVRISEDGSGATFVELAQRGTGLLAMMIDARVAMTPAHARPIAIVGGALKLGADAVVFVGGSAERHNAGALATARDGSAFELVAVADGAISFGMAAIRVDDPPREDEPVMWSLYPNGLDPAPIAATHEAGRMIVARVRPLTSEPKSTRVLEIGELSREGGFAPICIASEAAFIKDVELDLDHQGALWVFYRDPRGSVLERRALPARR